MIGASVIVLLLITYIPGISTFLPKALAGENGAYSGTVTASSDSADDAQADDAQADDAAETTADTAEADAE